MKKKLELDEPQNAFTELAQPLFSAMKQLDYKRCEWDVGEARKHLNIAIHHLQEAFELAR